MRTAHVINSLGVGGAEMMLCKLLEGAPISNQKPCVILLEDGGPLRDRVAATGAEIFTLGLKQGRIPPPRAIARLGRIFEEVRPDIIQGWMYHGNLAATAGNLFARHRRPVVWNVRGALDADGWHMEKRLTRAIIRLNAALSWSPSAIVYNSRVASQQHMKMGCAKDKTVIIPNGFDCDLFKPRREAEARLRQRLGVDEDACVIGMVARFHPMKDHENLLKAFSLLVKQAFKVHLVLVGRDVDEGNSNLVEKIRDGRIAGKVSLLGQRHDIPDLIAGLDIAVLSSARAEGFPNVVGEAMASGVPCIATDVGDSAWIIGETGKIVPPQDSAALASALANFVKLGREERRQLGRMARDRISSDFALRNVVSLYQDLYHRILATEKKAA